MTDYSLPKTLVARMTQVIANGEPANHTHESRIPPIANKARRLSEHHGNISASEFSFAVPASLAFFKRLTWELTPWTRPIIGPIMAATISAHVPSIPAEAIQYAVCIGVACNATTKVSKDQQPHLFVVFPHLRRPPNMRFLQMWHNEIVKPAFDEAWIHSGLVDIWENTENGISWSTTKAAPPFEKVCGRHFESDYPWRHQPQQIEWPKWDNAWEYSSPQSPYALSKGLEGGYSDTRARVFGEAWSAMCDMLKAGGEPREMSDPVLLAIWKKTTQVDKGVSADVLVKELGKEWDAYADSRFVNEGMFVVHLQGQIQQPGHKEEIKHENKIFSEGAQGLLGMVLRFFGW